MGATKNKREDVVADLPEVPETVSHIIDFLGGASAVGQFLGVRQSNVSNWKTNGGDGKGMIPAMYIGALARMAEQLGVTQVDAVVIAEICDRKPDQN